MEVLSTISAKLILLSALLVSGAVIYSTITTMRAEGSASAPSAD